MKIRIQFFVIVLLSLSHIGVANAVHLINLDTGGSCSPGETQISVGTGFINISDMFVPDIFGDSIAECIAPTADSDSNGLDVGTRSSFRSHQQGNAINKQLFTSFSDCKNVPPSRKSQNNNCTNAAPSQIVTDSLRVKGASSDSSSSLLPDTFWAVSSITEISDDTSGSHVDTDMYHFIGGADLLIDDFIMGASLTYAHTEDEQGRTHNTADTVGITPYLAYRFNDYLFASTLLGYNYTHINSTGGRSDMDENDFISETNINLFKVIDSFILKGRAGLRYKHTHTMLEKDFNGRDDDFDELTWLADIEVGYYFPNKLHIYTGLLYEYYDREASAASTLVHDGTGFMRYGAEYPIYKALTLGAKIEHDINDEDNDFITGSINARIDF